MSGEHAALQPSSSYRWVECAGSVKAEQQYPNVDTDESREGTAAHEVCEAILNGEYATRPDDGTIASNGELITEEMIDGAAMYVADIREAMSDDGWIGIAEHRVPINRVSLHNWGTCDYRALNARKMHIIIWDYKFGHGVVDIYNNWQMIEYAIGCVDEAMNSNALFVDKVTIEMRIVQPRAWHPDGPIRSWTLKGEDLRGMANRLKYQAELSMTDDAPTKAGPHCDYCKARLNCDTNRENAYRIASTAQRLQLHDLTPVEASTELSILESCRKMLDDRITILSAEAMHYVEMGIPLPFHQMGNGRGSKVWNAPVEDVLEIGDMMGCDLRKPVALVTSNQALKLNIDSTVINQYSDTVPGKRKLVKTDKSKASRLFGGSST